MSKTSISLISILALATSSFGAWKKQGSGTDYTTNSAPAAGDAFLLWDAGTNTTQNLYYSSLLSTMMGAPGNIGGTTPGTADFTAVSVGTLDVSGAASFDSIDVRSATWLDNVRITFNPGSTVAGINVGSFAGDPSTPINGDLWYDSVANELQARINGATVALGAGGGGGSGDALVANPLSQFAATTSAQLAGVITNETGTGLVVLDTSPTLVTPALGTPTALVGTNITGTATGLTAGISNALKSATTTVSVSAATAPSNGQVLTATGSTTATWQTPSASSGDVATDTIWDTAGDMVYGTGANTASKLAIGTAGQILNVNGGATAPAWTSTPSVSTLTVSGAVTAGSIAYNGALASDDTAGAITLTGLTAGATIAQWEAVYIGGSSTYLLADANGSGTYPARGLAVAAYSSTNAATIVTSGTVRNDAWAWTPGDTIYLSTTAGGLTQTIPSTAADKIQIIGYALTADIIMVAIGPDVGTVPTP